MTVFSENSIFVGTELVNDLGDRVSVWLKSKTREGTNQPGMWLQGNMQTYEGKLLDPVILPVWLKPNTILKGTVDGEEKYLKVTKISQVRLLGITEILGVSLEFDVMSYQDFGQPL